MQENEVVYDDELAVAENSGDEDSGPAQKRRRTTGVYHLLSFCEIRWCSSWSVMCRFYSLFPALLALLEKCRSVKYFKDNGGAEFKREMERIKKTSLRKVIHYLRPLAQGIDFCQSDSTIHTDVIPLLNALKAFYNSASAREMDSIEDLDDCLLRIPKERVEDIFLPRTQLFELKFTKLIALFFDRLYKDPLEEIDADDERLQVFLRQLTAELKQFIFDSDNARRCQRINKAKAEAMEYILQRRDRMGISVFQFFKQNSQFYQELTQIFRDICSMPASSASVERSFSVQGCFLQARRSNLDSATVSRMMLIRMNCLLAEKNGTMSRIVDYIVNRSNVPVQRSAQ